MEGIKKGEWFEIICPSSWEGKQIEEIIKQFFRAPRSYVHNLRMEKGVVINGQQLPWTYVIKQGDRFLIHLFPKESFDVEPIFAPLHILYEDDHVIVVNKQSGMDVHPSGNVKETTVSNIVAYHFLETGLETKVRHIHRLDKDTTGALLFAKHALAGAALDQMLSERIIKRTYLALVHGKLKQKSGTIDKPIGRDRHHSSRRRVSLTGQKAITTYHVLDYFSKDDISLVKLDLQTGRTHQIRVHLSDMKHPLVGDELYGGLRVNGAKRQALHAAKLTFPNPITNEIITCKAPFLDQPNLFRADFLQKI